MKLAGHAISTTRRSARSSSPTRCSALPVRRDILARVVNWQLAKRRAGTHKTKGISEISGTTKKPYKQKGTGRARQGSLRSPQFRGGARDLRPGRAQPRASTCRRRCASSALKTALSAKQADGKLVVIDDGQARRGQDQGAGRRSSASSAGARR